ncbi:MAG: hypothetical protein IJ581_03865 [Paludibacteraceae bacterium]|nr:hypothetical protein [Paludibacteraceae bacterium]
MKRFLLSVILSIGCPLLLLLGIYLWTDPFRCLHEFDINDIDATNREYLSTELFLRNYPTQHYNAFIFSSSRGGGFNTYTWQTYIGKDTRPFLFQAWGESLTGIELKMDYLDKHDVEIKHAIIMFDIPGTFGKGQLPHEALGLKHWIFTNNSKFTYNAIQFYNFIQKPSFWIKNIRKTLAHSKEACSSDTIFNDWEGDNYLNYATLPPQDSLKKCSDMTRRTFYAKLNSVKDSTQRVSQPVINGKFVKQLQHMKAILDKQNTDYHIVLSPAICYLNPAVNPADLEIIEDILGKERVHDYTGRNELTEDYNNFSDPNHFGLRVGYLIMQDIYGNR